MTVDISLTGYRSAQWRAALLDSEDRLLRDLEEFTGGNYEQSYYATIRGGGRVDLVFKGTPDIDWGSDRIMLWYSPNPGIEWPMGVFLITAPVEGYNDENDERTFDVEIMDKLAVLDQDVMEESYSLPEGTVITDAIRTIILGTGETNIALTESTKTLPSARVWEAGTTKLGIVNDLLAALNYSGLWCDGRGQYRAEPFQSAEGAQPSHIFEEGELSIHLPEWEREQDWFEIPNKVVQISQSTDEEEAMTVTVTNTNPASPYSYQSRGRWITLVEKNVEAADQATLNAIAQRRLLEASSKVVNLTVKHAPLDLWPNDVVEFRTSSYTGRATVGKYQIGMEPDALTYATWREVIRYE